MNFTITIDRLNGHDQEGKIGKISRKAGDAVKPGDILFTLESGKGSIKYESEYDGTLTELNIEEGQTVKKGQTVGSIEGEKAAASKETSKAYSFGLAKPRKEEHKVDVAIVGGGPGGYVAAIRGAQLGLKVALIEADRLGGTCLNRGCIPTKALAASVEVLRKVGAASDYGIAAGAPTVDMSAIIARKNGVVDTLVGGIEHLMEARDIVTVAGEAKVMDDKTLTVKTKKIDATVTFDHLIIATGSTPFMLPIEGSDLPGILTSESLLQLEEVPESMTIIGGGVIGMEFAFIFSALGTQVTVVEFAPEILALLDQDVVEIIKASAQEQGIRILTGAGARQIIAEANGGFITAVQQGEETLYLSSTKVLMAVGRRANIHSLDLEKLGVELNERKNGIAIDETCRTNREHIYAIGDVTNKIQLAHVASHQGMVAMESIAGMDAHMRYDVIPSAIFTHPEVGNVGMTEKEAQAKGIEVKVGSFPFMANGKALCMGEPEGLVKVIADAKTNVILGGVAVGIHATDMVATLAQLVGEGRTLTDAQHVVYAHPTTAEAIHESLLASDQRAIHF